MQEIVEWLIGVETLAGNLYRSAGAFFHKDKQLSELLLHLAEDEAWHFHAMGSAAQHLRRHPESAIPSVILDEETRKGIEQPFRDNLEALQTKTLTEESMLQCLRDTEFSEWNDLFLFVLNTLKGTSREFQYVAARLHGHLQTVTDFLAERPGGKQYVNTLRELPSVWEERVLVVDDDDAVRELIAAILAKQFAVETARDGSEGAALCQSNYFDAVVSDVNMPVMDGPSFLKRISASDPEIKNRFLFYAGGITENLAAYCSKNGVRFLEKPAPVGQIRKLVTDLVRSTGSKPS